MSCRLFSFRFLFSLGSLVNPPRPSQTPPEAHYVELPWAVKVVQLWRCTVSHMAFGRLQLIDDHLKWMLCQTRFLQMPWQALRTVFRVSSVRNVSVRPKHMQHSTKVSKGSGPFVTCGTVCVTLRMVLLPPPSVCVFDPVRPCRWLYIYLLSYRSSSMERPENVSWVWTEASGGRTSKPALPTPPEETALLLAPVVTSTRQRFLSQPTFRSFQIEKIWPLYLPHMADSRSEFLCSMFAVEMIWSLSPSCPLNEFQIIVLEFLKELWVIVKGTLTSILALGFYEWLIDNITPAVYSLKKICEFFKENNWYIQV